MLIELLNDLNGTVAQQAACALGRLGRAEARAPLMRTLQQAPSVEIIQAIEAVADEDCLVLLGRIGRAWPDLTDAVIAALENFELGASGAHPGDVAAQEGDLVVSRGCQRPGGGYCAAVFLTERTSVMLSVSRRAVLAGATLPLFAIRTRPASAAEFSFKMANNSPVTHPQSVRQQEAIARIKQATGGRVEIALVSRTTSSGPTPTCCRSCVPGRLISSRCPG